MRIEQNFFPYSITGAGRDFDLVEYLRPPTSHRHRTLAGCSPPRDLPTHDVTWPRPLSVTPPGGAKVFSLTPFFSGTTPRICELFSPFCAPRRPLLKFRGIWGWGVTFRGKGPPSENLLFFTFSKIRTLEFPANSLCRSNWGPLRPLKIWKKSEVYFPRK